jgi:large subunit ribosomal protein L10
MTKEQKTVVIQELAAKFVDSKYFYITDCSELTVEKVNNLRRACFEKGIKLQVVKNTLIQKALEKATETNQHNYTDLYSVLKGASALMFTEIGNVPAKLIQEFRKENDKPILKAAFIESDVYVGDDQLDSLSNIKSKEELIADVVLLLESPMKGLLGALQSGGNTVTGLLKALEERNA